MRRKDPDSGRNYYENTSNRTETTWELPKGKKDWIDFQILVFDFNSQKKGKEVEDMMKKVIKAL